jgi:hypothetical protein
MARRGRLGYVQEFDDDCSTVVERDGLVGRGRGCAGSCPRTCITNLKKMGIPMGIVGMGMKRIPGGSPWPRSWFFRRSGRVCAGRGGGCLIYSTRWLPPEPRRAANKNTLPGFVPRAEAWESLCIACSDQREDGDTLKHISSPLMTHHAASFCCTGASPLIAINRCHSANRTLAVCGIDPCVCVAFLI